MKYEFQNDFLQLKSIFSLIISFSNINLTLFIFKSSLALFLHLQI